MTTICNNTQGTNNKPYLPLRIGDLPNSIAARAERELGETEAVKARAFEEMRKLITEEQNLRCPTFDHYLLMFLRPRKFDVDRAFKLLQASWGVKRKYGYLYDNYDEESVLRTYDLKSMLCLPYRDRDGAAVFIVKMRNWDPDVSTMDQFVTALTYVCFYLTSEATTQVCGIRLIIDVGGMCFKQVRRCNPTALLIIANAFNSTIPARWVGVHIYNESLIWPLMWSVIKRFLSEKIRNRVHFHGSKTDDLHKYVPKEILPVDYDGDNDEDVNAWFRTEIKQFLQEYMGEFATCGYSK